MSWIITGGAGFIGSCLISRLNQEGIHDIIIVDNIAKSSKWLNLVNKHFCSYISKNEFLNCIDDISDLDGVIHLGACSSTTETNFDYLYANNYQYSIELYQLCARKNIPFIYASSAAVYGDGSHGFSEQTDLHKLIPLNRYGYSKLLFDKWVTKEKAGNNQCVGLRFFNVYGPNEYHKESMASMVYHGFQQIKTTGKIRLFKSENPHYCDGEQLRDFVYVKDVCDVILYFILHPKQSGIFNVGTGHCFTFNDLAHALFSALDKAPNIEYIDMPMNLKRSYQYYTKADIDKLRKCGYTREMMSLNNGVYEYVTQFLNQGCCVL